jgi:hypothetical protein
MRVGLVRNVGLSITALAVLALTACNDDPLDFDVKTTTGIETNPTEMVVAAGRTAELESRAVNQGGEPTFDAVSAAVDATCGAGAITVVPDPNALEIDPPGEFLVTGGATLGPTCIVLTSGSNTAQVDVTVVADAIEIVSPEDGAEFRAGETGQVVAQLVSNDGTVVGPYDPTLATFTSSNEDAIEFTDDVGNFTVGESGTSLITVTWPGDDSNGTAGLGVVRVTEINLSVAAGPPVAAAFASDPLGAFEVGDIDEFEVIVTDALGNQNTFADEITAVTAGELSSDPAVATATAELVDGVDEGTVNVIVTVEAIGGGSATISGVVTTTNGDLPFSADYFVPAPSITSLSATSGDYATTVTITGEQFSFPGLITTVLVDGQQLGNFTIVSDTEITAQMPTYEEPGVHNVVVNVNGIVSTEAITWEQTNACYAQDVPYTPGPPLYGPVVQGSIPFYCAGTATDADNSNAWFVATISEDALLGGSEVSVLYAPDWGPPLKDIDWLYCGDAGVDPGDPFADCVFEIDQPPATVDLDLGVGDHVFTEDDYASYVNGDDTVQDYTLEVIINQ